MTAPRHPEIMISGWYGQLNAGDDAILDVFVEQCQARYDANISVLSELPENIPPAPRVRALFHLIAFGRNILYLLLSGKFFRHFSHVKHSDIVALGGGGLLRDNTNWRNLIRLLDELWMARLFGRKTMLYAIGVGPFKTDLGRKVIGRTVRGVDLVTVRSEKCASLLREVGVPAERIHVVADPAFLLTPTPALDPELRALFAGGDKLGYYPTFALIMDDPDPPPLRQMAAALDALIESEGLDVVAMPMSVIEHDLDDVKTAERVRAHMRHPERFHIYRKRLSAAELKWVTGQAKMNITVRLHAMIFSLGIGVPVVAVNYEPKVANVFAAFGLPEYLVEMDGDLTAKLTRAATACLHNLDDYKARLAARMPETVANANKTFELMQGLLPR